MARARARPTKPLPEKTPANAARAVAAAVRAAWLRTRDELAKLVLDGADAHVHDLRVGLRRLLSALELAEALEAAPPPKVVKRLERILRSLSPLRDLEVERKTLAKLGEQEPSLAAIAARLERRRSALAKRLARKLAAFAPGPTEALLERCSAQLERDSGAPNAMNLLALAAVARRYAKFDRRRRAVAGSDRHALHRLRIAFKRYRYAVEVAAPALPNDAQSTLSNMKEFQEQLGAIQDASVLIETLERVTRARRKRHLASKAAIEALKLSRSERVEATLAALTAQVTAEPPAFSEIFS